MAEVTSGMRLTVLALQQHEADALAGLLHRWADDDTIDGDPRLWELYNAMVPCEDDEPIDYVPVGPPGGDDSIIGHGEVARAFALGERVER